MTWTQRIMAIVAAIVLAHLPIANVIPAAIIPLPHPAPILHQHAPTPADYWPNTTICFQPTGVYCGHDPVASPARLAQP